MRNKFFVLLICIVVGVLIGVAAFYLTDEHLEFSDVGDKSVEDFYKNQLNLELITQEITTELTTIETTTVKDEVTSGSSVR